MALWILQIKGDVHGSIFDHSVLQILIVGDGEYAFLEWSSHTLS